MGRRASTLAKELGVSSDDLARKCEIMGLILKSSTSAIPDDIVERLRQEYARRVRPVRPLRERKPPEKRPSVVKRAAEPPAKEPPKEAAALPKEELEKPSEPQVIKLKKLLTVRSLSPKFGLSPGDLTKLCNTLGLKAIQTTVLEKDALDILAHELGYRVEFELPAEPGAVVEEAPPAAEAVVEVTVRAPEEVVEENVEEAQQVATEPVAVEEAKVEVKEEELVVPRPPVVTFVGHVDHGKTSLLDVIRKTNVVAGEVGGITQHIGAYRVTIKDQFIVFLDTPGHEAFTEMRRRGVSVTDICVLVIAADDGIMPQTVEAINHAREAGAPIIVAINKVDKMDASPLRVRQQLTERQLAPEEWGGQTICVDVSAITQQGIDQLLEMILLQAEIMELKAHPRRRARGVVIESSVSPGRGPVATVLVKDGTLHVGEYALAGECGGKVRALLDERGKRLREAGPSTPVEVLGLNAVPQVGSEVFVPESEKEARELLRQSQRPAPRQDVADLRRATLEEFFRTELGQEKGELKVIIKGDVQGSVEALCQSLEKLATDKVSLKIIHSNVGDVNDSDVMLAAASNAMIVAFHGKINSSATEIAEHDNVLIESFDIIYEAIDRIRRAMEGLLPPEIREVSIGRAEIRQVFVSSALGRVAGCYVRQGRVQNDATAALSRDGNELWRGEIGSLKRFKDDVKEVKNGMECGIKLRGQEDVQEGDVLEFFVKEEIPQTL